MFQLFIAVAEMSQQWSLSRSNWRTPQRQGRYQHDLNRTLPAYRRSPSPTGEAEPNFCRRNEDRFLELARKLVLRDPFLFQEIDERKLRNALEAECIPATFDSIRPMAVVLDTTVHQVLPINAMREERELERSLQTRLEANERETDHVKHRLHEAETANTDLEKQLRDAQQDAATLTQQLQQSENETLALNVRIEQLEGIPMTLGDYPLTIRLTGDAWRLANTIARLPHGDRPPPQRVFAPQVLALLREQVNRMPEHRPIASRYHQSSLIHQSYGAAYRQAEYAQLTAVLPRYNQRQNCDLCSWDFHHGVVCINYPSLTARSVLLHQQSRCEKCFAHKLLCWLQTCRVIPCECCGSRNHRLEFCERQELADARDRFIHIVESVVKHIYHAKWNEEAPKIPAEWSTTDNQSLLPRNKAQHDLDEAANKARGQANNIIGRTHDYLPRRRQQH